MQFPLDPSVDQWDNEVLWVVSVPSLMVVVVVLMILLLMVVMVSLCSNVGGYLDDRHQRFTLKPFNIYYKYMRFWLSVVVVVVNGR